jgi:hypothetical protein
LIAAAIVIPPTTARLLTDSFGKMLILSTMIGAATGFFGMFLSYEYDIASGAAIVLLSAGIFAAVYAGTSLHKALVTGRERLTVEQPKTTMPSATGLARVSAPVVEDHLFD